MESRYMAFFAKRKWLGHTARALSIKGLAANLVVLYAMIFGDIHSWMSNILLVHFNVSSLILTDPLFIGIQIFYFTYAAFDNVLGVIKGCIRPIAGIVIERVFFFFRNIFIFEKK